MKEKAVLKTVGIFPSFFNMQRGVRQGCPISPILFILTVELFAKNVRNSSNIRGITLPGHSHVVKIRIYADDTTLILRDLIDFREILSKIKSFFEATGLVLNKSKCMAMYISEVSQKNSIKYGIKFVNKVKILGITFSIF